MNTTLIGGTATTAPSLQNKDLSALSTSLLNKVKAGKIEASGANTQDAIRKAANEFESIFLNTILQGMFEGISTEPPFGGGYSETVYRSMMVEEFSNQISKSGGIGLSDELYREMLAAQEGRDKP